jgi:hypothetical protein
MDGMSGQLSRRGLFGFLAGAAATPLVEQVSRSFFFAPIGGWTSKVIVNPDIRMARQYGLDSMLVTKEAFRTIKQYEFSSMASAKLDFLYTLSAKVALPVGWALNVQQWDVRIIN